MNQNYKRGNGGARIKRLDERNYKFYLVEPPENSNPDRLAERLIAIKNVEEVFVTDGDYGFIVKARFSAGKPDAAYNYISKLGNTFGRATSYYQYKK